MTYPYPELLPLLQMELDVPSYLDIVRPILYPNDDSRIHFGRAEHSRYWYQMPVYRYTYCPFCENWYTAPLDRYTLWGWGAGARLMKIPYGEPTRDFKECAHFVGIHLFLHLHTTVPEGIYYSTKTGEVPFITPWFFADDLACFAVLSALPICRIVGTQFGNRSGPLN